MVFHAKQFNYLKNNCENLAVKNGENLDKIFNGCDENAIANIQQEFMNIIIHGCDISNPTKPYDIYSQWVDRVMDEFWLQGDKEKELKLPVSFLCDRLTVTKPFAQMTFINGIVEPFINVFTNHFPGLMFLLDNIIINKSNYKKLKEEEDALKGK